MEIRKLTSEVEQKGQDTMQINQDYASLGAYCKILYESIKSAKRNSHCLYGMSMGNIFFIFTVSSKTKHKVIVCSGTQRTKFLQVSSLSFSHREVLLQHRALGTIS